MDPVAAILGIAFTALVVLGIILDIWRGGPDNDQNDGCTM